MPFSIEPVAFNSIISLRFLDFIQNSSTANSIKYLFQHRSTSLSKLYIHFFFTDIYNKEWPSLERHSAQYAEFTASWNRPEFCQRYPTHFVSLSRPPSSIVKKVIKLQGKEPLDLLPFASTSHEIIFFTVISFFSFFI